MKFTREKFERFSERCPKGWRSEALAVATVATDTSVELPSTAFTELRLKYFPSATTALKPFGLGDAVATVAEPIARLSDALLGTSLVGCGGCAQRRAALNALVPDVTKPTG
jgi:hypothetical protein